MGQETFGGVQQFITDICKVTGDDPNSASARDKVLTAINVRYPALLAGKSWRFLQKELYIELKMPYETGTVSINQGSSTVTGVGTAFDASMVNQKFVIRGLDAVYEVESVTNATELQLKGVFTDEDVSAVNFTIFFDTYSREENIDELLRADLGGVSGRNPSLRLVGLDHFRQVQKNSRFREGPPEYITGYVDIEDADPDWSFEVTPAPDKAYSLLLTYNLFVSAVTDDANSFFLLPNKYRHVLFYAVAADVSTEQENTTRAADFTKKFQSAYMKMTADYYLTDKRTRFRNEKPYFERSRNRSRSHYNRSYGGDRVDLD